jgi:homoserine O-acetyltransferase
MIAHITYMSKDALHQKFGRNLQNSKDLGYNFDIDFQIESYLHHQGYSFVERFDPNSYLYITKAMDYFDLEEEFGGNLSAAFSGCDDVRFCLVSFSDDWLFTCDEAKYLAKSLNIAGADVSFVNIESKNGHDSFLLENKPLGKTIKGFLDSL